MPVGDQNDSDKNRQSGLSPEEYRSMDEKEKDAEIARSIIRLQNKIRNILYMTESEKARKENTGKIKNEEENNEET